MVICKVSTHGEVVDHGGADDCHLYFGRDLAIVDGTAEVGVEPVHKDIEFFANQEQLTAHANSMKVRFEDNQEG